MNFSLGFGSNWLRAHWFFPTAAAVLVANLTILSLENWTSPRLIEAALLFDLSVVIPLLYVWCYRSRGKQVILRAVALGCLGIWVAGHAVPQQHHHLLTVVGFVRYLGLAVLLAIEIKLIVMIYRAACSPNLSAKDSAVKLATESGMPEWAARLMAWEASLWRRAWGFIVRVFDRLR